MIHASVVEVFFTPEFVELCRFYLVTFAVGFTTCTALYLAWISTGLAPLDYYVWLVQLAQSPGRRIIQVFTLNNDIHGNSLEPREPSYMNLPRNDDAPLPEQNVPAQENPTSSNDQDLEQTTVVIIQTPYSVTRFADDSNGTSDGNSRRATPSEVHQPDHVSADGLTQTFHIEVPAAAPAQAPLSQSSVSPNSAGVSNVDITATVSNNAGPDTINSNADTINNVVPSGQEDINAIFRVLRTNTDSAIATAATIALYSREISTSSNPPAATPLPQQSGAVATLPTVSPSTSSQSANNGGPRNLDVNNGGRHQLLVSRVSMSVESPEETSDPSQSIFISYDNLRAIPTQDVFSSEFIPNFNTSGFLDSSSTSSTVSTASFSSSTSTSSSWTRGSMTANTSSNDSSFVHVDGQGNLAGDGVAVDALDESTPSTSGIFSADSSQCTVNSPQHNAAEVERKKQSEEKRWESALTTIRLKFLDDTQRLVKTWLDTSVGDFKRRYFSDSLDSGKVVRLIFQGQLLRDDTRSLASYGIHDQCAVHCHVGSRPYSQQNNVNETVDRTQLHQDDTATNGGSALGSRLMSLGTSWMDIFFLMLWSGLVYLWNWAQNVDENNNQTTGAAADNDAPNIWRRFVQQFRNFVRIALSCLFDASLFAPNRQRGGRRQRLAPGQNPPNLNDNHFGDDEDNYRFNAGTIFGLLIAIKISTLWILVIYFPQFVDFKGVLFLGILTMATAMYFFFNHVNNTVQNLRGPRNINPQPQQWRWQRATIGRQ